MSTIKRVIINLQYEGTHNWPECPIPEVAFLKDEHRHVFHICCKKSVSHDDRDVEIIMLKRDVLAYLQRTFNGKFGRLSCETIAGFLMKRFGLDYCSVLEDGENGAEIEITTFEQQ